MFKMVIEKVVVAELNDRLKNLTTVSDKRTIVIGFAKVIGETHPYLEYVNQWL